MTHASPSLTDPSRAHAARIGGARAVARVPVLAREWGAAFVLALTLYVATAMPGVQWQDGGEQQLRIIRGEISHRLGLALIHPIHYWLGRGLYSLGIWDPPFAITLASVIPAAATIANVFLILRMLCKQLLPAGLGAASLLLGHTFWLHATITETYGLVAFTLTTEIMLLTRYCFGGSPQMIVAAALANGLGVANHLLNVLVLPVHAAVGFGTAWRGRVRWRTLALAAAWWLVAFLPYLTLIVAEARRIGVADAIESALFGNFQDNILRPQSVGRRLALGPAYVLYNFPGLALFWAAFAILKKPRPHVLWWVLVLDGLILFTFAARYDVPDQFAFFFPFYVIVAILFGWGLDRYLLAARNGWRRVLVAATVVTTLWTPLVYWGTAKVLQSRGVLRGMVGNKPYRDGYAAFFVPWNQDSLYGDQLNKVVFEAAGPDGLILCNDAMISLGVQTGMELKRCGPDVRLRRLVPEMSPDELRQVRRAVSSAVANGRPVVLIPRDRDHPPDLLAGATWTRIGDVYRLEAWAPAPGPQP